MTAARVSVVTAAVLALSGCAFFSDPNLASAPMRASLVAEALYAGPLVEQPAELKDLGRPCDPQAEGADAIACRFDNDAVRTLQVGGVRFREPSAAGVTLRKWYLRWTQLYRLWDRAFSSEYGVEVFLIDQPDEGQARLPELRPFWGTRAQDGSRLDEPTFTPLVGAFNTLEEVSRIDYPIEQNALGYEYRQAVRDALEARIAALLVERKEASRERRAAIEKTVRSYLEVLAGLHQRAAQRVARLEAFAREEAELYATLREQAAALAGLQRNVSNFLMQRDLIVSPSEVEAVFDTSRETYGRIRKQVEDARTAERERQKETELPDWVGLVERALARVRGED